MNLKLWWRKLWQWSPVKIRGEGDLIGNGISLQWWKGPRVHFGAGRLRATLGWHERLKLEAWVAWRAVGNDSRLVVWDAGRRRPRTWIRGK